MTFPRSTAIAVAVLLLGACACGVFRSYRDGNLRRACLHPDIVAVQARRIRVRTMENVRFIRKVEPVYPEQAKAAHVGGVVDIHIVIGTDGRVKEATRISGDPLLVTAAIDAIDHWQYEPISLNGNPVEVDTTVTVDFRLD